MESLHELKSGHLLRQVLDALDKISSEKKIRELIAFVSEQVFHGNMTDKDADTALKVLESIRALAFRKATAMERIPDQCHLWKEEKRTRFKPHFRKKMPTEKKQAYMARRRDLAGGGFLPKEMLRHFTTGQQAALAIIAQEVGKHGTCTLVIEKIAALAGVCHATVRRALARAMSDECRFLIVEYRERRGRPNLANIVRIISSSWLGWIRNRFSQKFDFKKAIEHFSNKIASLGLWDCDRVIQKCNPTPYTLNIKGSRLDADYSFSNFIAMQTLKPDKKHRHQGNLSMGF